MFQKYYTIIKFILIKFKAKYFKLFRMQQEYRHLIVTEM
jgi:hypothetical protein